MRKKDKTSLKDLRKNLGGKVLDKGKMSKLKGGKKTDVAQEKKSFWSGFGGFLPS